MEAFDYDPLRQRALGDLAATSRSQYQTALSGQAAAGGLTAADRMALASSFNRSRMVGEADLLGQFGVAQGQNIWETEQANKDLLNKAYLQNLETMNAAQLQNIGTLMGQQEKADWLARNLYETDLSRRVAAEMSGVGYEAEMPVPAAVTPTVPAAAPATPAMAPAVARDTRPAYGKARRARVADVV